MLTIRDRLSRRTFLQAGGLALGGISLPTLLHAEAEAGVRSQRSVIMIFLSGGPPHQDFLDLKPDAPAEIRGEFNPIRTTVPGLDICEHLPLLAARAKRFAVIRSLVGALDRHEAFQCLTGRTATKQPPGGWPAIGPVVSKLLGRTDPAVPAAVSLSPSMKSPGWSDPGRPGFLGAAHAPFRPNDGGLADLLPTVSAERLDDRAGLLRTFDAARRAADRGAVPTDPYTEQALGILTSPKLADALDLSREDARVRDRYGRGSPEPAGYGDAGPLLNDYFLTARRLVEAGCRVVTLAYGRWDWHGKPHGTTFENARHHMPMLDLGLSALLDDLDQRGMLDTTTVLVWGEFGRTPKINANAGRDHWPQVGCGLVAGGGLRTGQVIGATNRLGEFAKERPVAFQEVFATLYHQLGIAETATVTDFTNRPHDLTDGASPIRELVG